MDDIYGVFKKHVTDARGARQLLNEYDAAGGLLGAAGLPGAAPPDAAGVIVRSTVKLPTAEAALSGRDEVQRRVAEALLRGAVTIDEVVAASGLSVGAVLGAVTRLEASGLVRAIHGRYEPAGPLAAAQPPKAKPAAA